MEYKGIVLLGSIYIVYIYIHIYDSYDDRMENLSMDWFSRKSCNCSHPTDARNSLLRVPANWSIRPTSDPNFNCPIPYQWIGLRETNSKKAVDLCLIYHWGCLEIYAAREHQNPCFYVFSHQSSTFFKTSRGPIPTWCFILGIVTGLLHVATGTLPYANC